MGFHVYGFGVSSSVAEGLHHHVSAKAQARQVFQLVTRHRTSSILATYGGHFGFAVSAWTDAFAFWQATSTTHHFLRQRKAFTCIYRRFRQTEFSRRWQAQ